MLRKRTAFILGAGASQPFRFPTGEQLYKDMLIGLMPRNDLFQRLQRFGDFSEAEIAEFRGSLGRSGRKSVDAFLEHRSEYMLIGKSAIAARLIACENEDTLFGNGGDWMSYLFAHLDHTFQEGPTNGNVAFITFNYDRALEHFLFTAFENSFGKNHAECAAALRHIPIIHLHGRLGRLPWQEGEDAERSYHDLVDTETLNVAREGIKIVHENMDDGRDKDFVRAREILIWAQQVYFLGFGYGETNMKRLRLDELDKNASGTGNGLTDAETSYVRAQTDSKVNPEDFNCLGFLRNRVNWGVP